MDDKVIVSNRTALVAKYTGAGATRIEKAVRELIAADAKRGIKSRLVYLDDARAMRIFRGTAVNERTNARQNKQAIDAIFRATTPDYLMILGATDVVPHQDMMNPAFDPPDDPDRYAYGWIAARSRYRKLVIHFISLFCSCSLVGPEGNPRCGGGYAASITARLRSEN